MSQDPTGAPVAVASAAAPATPFGTRLDALAKRTDLVFSLGVIGILAVLILPVPSSLLSFLIAVNLTVSMVVLLVCIYAKHPLEFKIGRAHV